MKNQRSELSVKNRYYIPRLRYLELKNFALQYPTWKLARSYINDIEAHSYSLRNVSSLSPTELIATKKAEYDRKIEMIESAAYEADPSIASWILEGVTHGYSYDYLSLKINMPAGRELYYDRYRKFFWILDKKRG